MKKHLIAALVGLSLLVGGPVTAWVVTAGHAAGNPHCAGQSDNFKSPNQGVVHNFPGC